MTKKILVIGATGLVGQGLKKISSSYDGYTWLWPNKQELDITNPASIDLFMDKYQPNVSINCAAYTAVDQAEQEQELAFQLNFEAVWNLAVKFQQQHIPWIHLSTDYVFDGFTNKPYVETSSPNPINIYGASKWRGEEAALNAYPQTIIIRTSWLYAPFGENFFTKIKKRMLQDATLSIVYDQIGTPTYVIDLVHTIIHIVIHRIMQPNKEIGGIYHYSQEGVTSWYDFAIAIKEEMQSPCKIIPILSSQYPTPAKRPFCNLLSKQKIKDTFGLSIPHWRERLTHCVNEK